MVSPETDPEVRELKATKASLQATSQHIQARLSQKRLYDERGRMLGEYEFHDERTRLQTVLVQVNTKLRTVKNRLHELVGEHIAASKTQRTQVNVLLREVCRVREELRKAQIDRTLTDAARHCYGRAADFLDVAIERSRGGD